ncbi:MAG: protease inhibitor I42 family protein [Acidobacteriota bacterium]|nr:protease inhibitor I42 family protein [Acidobacteriota bacterium]
MIVQFLMLGAALSAHPFNQSAVWTPPGDFRQQVLAKCSNAGTRFGQCFVQQMKASGASSDARTFSGLLYNDGYMQAFRPVGVVGMAAVNYPFRANENNGLFLVNGEPPAIDVDDLRALPQDRMKSNSAYLELPKHSNATLWPGNRASVNDLLALEFPDGSQQFVADYRVQDGCHACAILGQAFFSFVFDKTGKFTGANFTGFTTTLTPNTATSQRIVAVPAGKAFTVVLPSNRTTGYSWKLSFPADRKVLSSVGHHYGESAGQQMSGAGGEERWTFHAVSAGQVTLTFNYVRPWEKTPASPQTLVLTVEVQ